MILKIDPSVVDQETPCILLRLECKANITVLLPAPASVPTAAYGAVLSSVTYIRIMHIIEGLSD